MSLLSFGAYQIKSGEKFDLIALVWRALDFHIVALLLIMFGSSELILTTWQSWISVLVNAIWKLLPEGGRPSSLPGAGPSTNSGSKDHVYWVSSLHKQSLTVMLFWWFWRGQRRLFVWYRTPFLVFFWSLVFCFWILRTLENRRNQQKPTWSHKWYKGRLPYCFCRLDTFPVKNSVDAIALDQFTFDRAVGLRWIVWGVEILHGNPDSHMRGYHLSKRNSVLSYRKTTHSLPSLLVSLFLWWIALRRSWVWAHLSYTQVWLATWSCCW